MRGCLNSNDIVWGTADDPAQLFYCGQGDIFSSLEHPMSYCRFHFAANNSEKYSSLQVFSTVECSQELESLPHFCFYYIVNGVKVTLWR